MNTKYALAMAPGDSAPNSDADEGTLSPLGSTDELEMRTPGGVPEPADEPAQPVVVEKPTYVSVTTGDLARIHQQWQRLMGRSEATEVARRTEPRPGRCNVARRLAAIAVVLLCVVGFFATRASDSLAICTHEETSRSGVVTRIESCKPLPVQDVVPGLLLALALLWPDLSSFELAGIGRIQRRLEGQEVRQEILERQQNLLMQTVASSAASARSEMHLSLANPDLADVVRRLTDLEKHSGATSSELPSGHSLPRLPGESDEPAGSSTASAAAADRSTREAPIVSPGEQLAERTRDLRPWLEYVRKLGDTRFVDCAAEWAEGVDAAALSLPVADQRILEAVERVAGRRVPPDRVREWSGRRQLEIRLLRQSLETGSALGERAANSAAAVAEGLREELKATGLAAAPTSGA